MKGGFRPREGGWKVERRLLTEGLNIGKRRKIGSIGERVWRAPSWGIKTCCRGVTDQHWGPYLYSTYYHRSQLVLLFHDVVPTLKVVEAIASQEVKIHTLSLSSPSILENSREFSRFSMYLLTCNYLTMILNWILVFPPSLFISFLLILFLRSCHEPRSLRLFWSNDFQF